MEYHLERKIRLQERTKDEGLYNWSLQEIDENDEQVGSDQIPWQWGLDFVATELRYSTSISSVGHISIFEEYDPANVKPGSVSEGEQIEATLRPGYSRGGVWVEGARYSMFGTKRNIGAFNLVILPLEDEASTERCNAWGVVSYTSEVDFRNETEDDVLTIYLRFRPSRFERLSIMIREGRVASAHLRIGLVSGFYSDWSPSISTSSIKVLTSGTDQEVDLPADCEVVPPRLKDVGEFRFDISSTQKTLADQQIRQAEQEWKNELYGEDDWEENQESEAELVDPNAAVIQQLQMNEKAIRRFLLPLWIVVIAVVFMALQRF